MNDRKSDDLDGLPSLAPSSDDIASRRSSRRGEPLPARTSSSAGGVVTNVVLAVTIAGLTACGWFIATQNDALLAAQAERDAAVERLQRIEERLQMTDAALSDTESETQEQLSFWETEIRKLWDVSNKRNRDWIEDNQQAIAGLRETLEKQNRTLDQVQAQAAELRRGMDTQDQILEQLTILDRRASDLLSQQRTLTDSVNTLRQTTASLERRVDDASQGVESMDAFRRDMVARVTRLSERVDALSGAGSGGGSQTVTPTPGD
jgi:uncharacterized protein YoxC